MPGGLPPNMLFGQVSQRQEGAGQRLPGNAPQHVGLILGLIDAWQQPETARGVLVDNGIMTGGDTGGPQAVGLLQEGVPLDMAVALHTGIGGAAGQVLGHKIVDHPRLEGLLEVEGIVGHPQGNAHLPGVVDSLHGAAAALAHQPAVHIAVFPQLHGDADGLVAGLQHFQQGHRAVHPA